MKKILFTLCLEAALTGAQGQIYIDSYRFAGPSECGGLLLDSDCIPDAEFAVSLRKLRTAYTGNCVEVRNASTGRTFTVGFSGDFIDTVRLKDSCATANCFVRTWYDQSGLGRDALQTTTDARQPQITSSGALFYTNGKMEIRFDNTSGSEDVMTAGTAGNFNFLHNGTPSSVFAVARPFNSATPGNNYMNFIATATNTTSILLGIGYATYWDNRSDIGRGRLYAEIAVNGSNSTFPVTGITDTARTNLNAINFVADFIDADNATAANRSELYLNNDAVYKKNTQTGTVSASNSDVLKLSVTTTPTFQGSMFEIIITDIDYKTKISSVKTNINNFYSIW